MEDEVNNLCDEAESWPLFKTSNAEDVSRQIFIAKILCYHRRQFFEDGVGLSLLDAIELSFREGFSCPWWVHKKLHEVVVKFAEKKGRTSLNDLLGFGVTTGKNTKFEDLDTNLFRYSLVMSVSFLNKVVGFKLPTCFKILEKAGVEDELTGKNIYKSYSTIEDIYRKYKPKLPKRMVLFDLNYCESMALYFKEKYEDAFLSLCSSGDIAGKEKDYSVKKYQYLTSNSKK